MLGPISDEKKQNHQQWLQVFLVHFSTRAQVAEQNPHWLPHPKQSNKLDQLFVPCQNIGVQLVSYCTQNSAGYVPLMFWHWTTVFWFMIGSIVIMVALGHAATR